MSTVLRFAAALALAALCVPAAGWLTLVCADFAGLDDCLSPRPGWMMFAAVSALAIALPPALHAWPDFSRTPRELVRESLRSALFSFALFASAFLAGALLNAIPGIRVQAPGKHATLQSYYIFAIMVDSEHLQENITRQNVLDALHAEGVTGVVTGWGQPMYRQNLWTVPTDKYRIESSENAEKIVCNDLMMCLLQWLMLPQEELSMMADAFEKVMAHYYRA